MLVVNAARIATRLRRITLSGHAVYTSCHSPRDQGISITYSGDLTARSEKYLSTIVNVLLRPPAHPFHGPSRPHRSTTAGLQGRRAMVTASPGVVRSPGLETSRQRKEQGQVGWGGLRAPVRPARPGGAAPAAGAGGDHRPGAGPGGVHGAQPADRGAPALASGTTLYAYVGGGAPGPSPASCPPTTAPADQCTLTEALATAAPGDMVALATPGATVPTSATGRSTRRARHRAPRDHRAGSRRPRPCPRRQPRPAHRVHDHELRRTGPHHRHHRPYGRRRT